MDKKPAERTKECLKVLDPESRLKLITSSGNAVVIDANIPTKRYYRSGIEMLRMANVYLDEGSLENAFILYLKFVTLFIEKIRTHPEFNSVPVETKSSFSVKLKEVLPIAENLKSRLLEQYTKEYERYKQEVQKREEVEKERKELAAKAEETRRQLEEERSSRRQTRSSEFDKPRQELEAAAKFNISPVPPLNDGLFSDSLSRPEKPSPQPQEKLQLTLPTVNRSTKPTTSILSPGGLVQGQKEGRLRPVIIPGNLMSNFLQLAFSNTTKNIETCAILAGKLRRNQLVISHLLVPAQIGSADSCTTQKEEDLFDYQDQNDLITFGWIHTHPTQTAFLSSVDLHTHCSYQRMMPEAVAIVCAPRYNENAFFCLTPDYGLDYISNCHEQGFHPHPNEPPLYMIAVHCEVDPTSFVEVVDFRR